MRAILLISLLLFGTLGTFLVLSGSISGRAYDQASCPLKKIVHVQSPSKDSRTQVPTVDLAWNDDLPMPIDEADTESFRDVRDEVGHVEAPVRMSPRARRHTNHRQRIEHFYIQELKYQRFKNS